MAYNFCSAANIASIDVDCELKQGFETVGWVAKKSDLASVAISGNQATLTMASGAKFSYIGQLKQAFNETTTAIEAGTYFNTFVNTVSFNVFANDDVTASIIDGLANGEYVFVLEQKQKDVTVSSSTKYSTYRVFGAEQGCVMTACDNDAYNADIRNGWRLQFQETGATHSALYLTEFASTMREDPS